MTVEEMIALRTAALQTALGSANSAIAAKGGAGDADTVTALADAIGTIPQGSSVTVEPLSITENGTYTADQGKAYSPVTVNVQGAENPHVIHYTPAIRSGTVTLEHGLGYVPTMCVCLCLDLTSGTTGKAKNIAACSSFGNAAGRTVGFNSSGSIDNINIGCNINSATETSATIGGGWAYDAGAEYVFVLN